MQGPPAEHEHGHLLVEPVVHREGVAKRAAINALIHFQHTAHKALVLRVLGAAVDAFLVENPVDLKHQEVEHAGALVDQVVVVPHVTFERGEVSGPRGVVMRRPCARKALVQYAGNHLVGYFNVHVQHEAQSHTGYQRRRWQAASRRGEEPVAA
ncbi:5-formyltetrahydrofolate cyclo-ligase [Babesia caballi]|uniref:5-formyltetrahydrofolate cyclo-ligase n=1 Tax=Babesia caballi TaxID=5871 RepID=A0AAV4LZH8_BABCB|nr:5-formyltetrahydrofolate cyclo-ligase [Babesia caballi]